MYAVSCEVNLKSPCNANVLMLHRVKVEVKVEVVHGRSTVSSSMANQPEPCPTQMTLATPVSIRFANVISDKCTS